jgi:ABC-type Zn uptake system ZnuABC Zn-binding protein ZnuA
MRIWHLFLCAALVSTTLFAAKLNVVATLPVLGDIAKKVGGEFVEVKTLAEPNQDPHFVIPVPTLMKKTRDADVFIENGLSLELWAQKVIDGSGNRNIQLGKPGRVIASKGIASKEVPSVMSRELGDIHPGGNPHVWLDPENAKIIARNIANGLSGVDPAHKDAYAAAAKKFAADVDAKMPAWTKLAETLKGKQVITYHKSFIYFANRFGFTIPMEIEEKPGITPSARHRDALIALMNNQKINRIVIELYYDRTAPDFIAAKTGAKVVQVPIDVGADKDAMDYFSLIDLLLKRLQ